MSELRRLRRESERQQATQKIRRAIAARRAGPPKPIFVRVGDWFSSRKPLTFIGAVVIALLMATPVLMPKAGALPAASPTTDQPTPVPTPGRGEQTAPEMKLVEGTTYGASIIVPNGRFILDFDTQNAPLAANAVVALARSRFYTDSTVYKVEPTKYVLLGGLNADGTGTPGYTIAPDKSDRKLAIGSVAVVLQNGQVSSQLMVALDDADPGVPYLVVGRITDGLDIVRNLKVGDKIAGVNITERK